MVRYVMGRNTRAVKEFTREQRIIKENKQLKRELAHLRKQIARIETGRFETAKRLSDQEESQVFQENIDNISSNLEDLKKEWTCRDCKVGFLEIFLYTKLGQVFYYRKCNSCNNRTKGKRYDSGSVRGIISK